MLDKNITEAIRVVKEGGIIIYPTDTAFGIGCRIDAPKSIDKLFEIRRRPPVQAMPVLVSSKEQALLYYDSPSDIVRHLMKTYWPGALTIVDRCKKELIYSPIRGGGNNVGMRWPNHEVISAIILGVGVPIVGPSANFHGEPTPYTLEAINKNLIQLVDFVVPGECTLKQASTVIDCTKDPYMILRQGAVHI